MGFPRSWPARIALFFVVFYLLSQPANAARTVNTGFSKLGDAGNALSTFFNHLGR